MKLVRLAKIHKTGLHRKTDVRKVARIHIIDQRQQLHVFTASVSLIVSNTLKADKSISSGISSFFPGLPTGSAVLSREALSQPHPVEGRIDPRRVTLLSISRVVPFISIMAAGSRSVMLILIVPGMTYLTSALLTYGHFSIIACSASPLRNKPDFDLWKTVPRTCYGRPDA